MKRISTFYCVLTSRMYLFLKQTKKKNPEPDLKPVPCFLVDGLSL